MEYQGKTHCVAEWSFAAERKRADPFNDIELDVVFTAPDGTEKTVPAFWAGGDTWKIRYAAPTEGVQRRLGRYPMPARKRRALPRLSL